MRTLTQCPAIKTRLRRSAGFPAMVLLAGCGGGASCSSGNAAISLPLVDAEQTQAEVLFNKQLPVCTHTAEIGRDARHDAAVEFRVHVEQQGNAACFCHCRFA